MSQTTQYQPINGDERGPLFSTMTEASLWVVQQPKPGEWTVELRRAQVGETYAEFCARKDREQAEEDELREVEHSQRQDYKWWRTS
jgi:hypothetical protein